MLRFLPKASVTSLCCKPVHKKVRKRSQLLVLGHIDIQAFIFQPVIGIDANILLFIRVNDKGLGGILVAVSFQNLRTAVVSRIPTAGQIRNCRYDSNRLAGFVPADN